MVLWACAWDPIPRTASGRACVEASECPAIICTCGDGTNVRHRGCVNRQCQTPEDWCLRACEELGGWTPRDAGLTLCNDHPECPGSECRCVDGQTVQGAFCSPDGQCGDEPSACAQGCITHGGWADCIPLDGACESFSAGCCGDAFCDESATCRDFSGDG